MGSSLILKGGSTAPKTIEETISVAHSFEVGDVVRFDTVANAWTLAQANNAENSEVVGVIKDAQVGSFKIVYSGYIELNARYGTTDSPVLFLSADTAGELVESPPSAIGTVVKPVLTRKSGSGTGEFIVMNYLGTQIGGSSTVSIEQIQPVGTIMPYAAESTIPETWLECNGVSYSVTEYPELYSALLNTTGDATPKYGSVVAIVGTSNISLEAGNIILFKRSTTTEWSNSPTAENLIADKNMADVVGIVLNNVGTTIFAQIQPKYNSTTQRFEYPNIQMTAGQISSTLSNRNRNYRIWSGEGGGVISSNIYSVTSVTTTHFNTPDLRSRFPIGASAGTYPLANFGGSDTTAFSSVSSSNPTGTATNLLNSTAANPTATNIPPYLAVRYIIKAQPYTRAAIIDGVDIPYDQLLVTDLRSGLLRNAGAGEDLEFKTNTSVSTTGTRRMILTNGGSVLVADSPTTVEDVSSGNRILHIQGSTAAVRVKHDNGANTYFASTQTSGTVAVQSSHPLTLKTENTDRLTINAGGTIRTHGLATGISGSLGIGPSEFTPAQSFHLKNATPVIRLEDTDDGIYSEISANSGSDTGIGSLVINSDGGQQGTNSFFGLRVRGTERIRGTTTGVNITGNTVISATSIVDINTQSGGEILLGDNDTTVRTRGRTDLGNSPSDRIQADGTLFMRTSATSTSNPEYAYVSQPVSTAPCGFVRAWAVIDPKSLITTSSLTAGLAGNFNISGVRRIAPNAAPASLPSTIYIGFSTDFRRVSTDATTRLDLTDMCVIVQPYHQYTPNNTAQTRWNAVVVAGDGSGIYIGLYDPSTGARIDPLDVYAGFGIRVMVIV